MFPTNNNEIKIELTDAAYKQIQLIQENDFTLEEHTFRLKIGGKGCDGFTYETGFSKKVSDDLTLEYEHNDTKLNILIDSFAAFYCKSGILDFFIIPHENEDGFFFINKNEDKHVGKFFKDGDNVPTLEQKTK